MAAILARAVKLHVRSIVLAVVAFTTAEAFADETYPRIWLNPGFYSYHLDQEADLRENNIGFGAEIQFRRNHALMLGTFLNSDDGRTRYGAYVWRPLHWEPAKIDVSAGLVGAVLDGYPQVRNGDWFVALLPMVSVQWKRIGANVILAPTIKDRLHGAIAIQLKIGIW